MKELFTAALMLATVSTSLGAVSETVPVMDDHGIMKALPIYSNDLIDKAPEGETVTGIRDCFSSYFQGGNYYRAFQNGVAGEYVIGADGNVYLRAVCYSASQISKDTDTYLKLEKVDDKTYVAHTPQLIWVDNSGDSPFTAYATRVVFSQKSATSFGYEIQQTSEGKYDTDIYFTLENGKLSQKNMNTVEMNDEIFAEELIGFTTSQGSWIGFGDGCLQICQPEEKPTVLPEGTKATEKSLDYTLLHVRDIELDNAVLLKYAESGDDIYISNPSARTEQWIKGSVDRANGTATFRKQYLGMDTESGYAVWFIPAEYDKYLDILDEESGFGDWFRTYTAIDELVFSYTDGNLECPKGKALYFSHSPETLLETGVFADPEIRPYESKSSTPAPVTFTKFEPYHDMWGFAVIGFAIPCMDTEGNYINSDELYYNVFADDSDTPFVFTPDDYIDMTADSMTDVPYGYYEDFDFKVNGVNHTVYLYHDWQKVGVQVIQKHDGVETRSKVVYTNDETGIDSVEAESRGTYNKTIENGEIIIVRDGIRHNVLGIPVNN